ncbi:orotidine-5'-phosphate decarboxylase [Aquipuribacter nitratireducens]|uniref:Orotidine 5'-phosphate decarboxylase n=1 Tax=Aquipuribacter nitratireducens TaxID=650104 RepID=A0ABW0GRU0_9MICO
MRAFGDRLQAALRARGPLCVGLDPAPATLARWGLADDVDGLRRFGDTVLDAVAGRVALLKPQVAFYERFGSRGLAALEDVLARCRTEGQLVLADAKRGDIGSTAAGYAAAWCDDASPLAADAVTLSPYLGYGALAPAVETAAASGRGVFVLCLTSNPEGAGVQLAGPTPDGAPSVAAHVAAAAAADNARRLGDAVGPGSVGPVGLVVGATVGHHLRDAGVDLAAVRGHLLVPGLGAQGATPDDVARHYGDLADRVVPTASREVLHAGPDAVAVREAAERLAAACAAALGRPGR